MSQQEQAQQVRSTPVARCAAASAQLDLRDQMRRLTQHVETGDAAGAWARLAAHAPTLERSSYAEYLNARFDLLLRAMRRAGQPNPIQLQGVRRVLEAILEDVLQDPRRLGQAPSDAATFNQWWDCVVGLISLEAQREAQLRRALISQTEGDGHAGLELAAWVHRLAGVQHLSVLRRAQLLAELLGAVGVSAVRLPDEASLVTCYQAWARRTGLQVRASAARAGLCDLGVGGLLRLLAPQRCCALSKVSLTPQDGHVALADYQGCWAALARISEGDLLLDAMNMHASTTPDGQTLLKVVFHANGMPFEFDYAGPADGFDEHFVEHLNRVAQALQLPGSFLVDRVNSDTDVEVAYLPLYAAAALQLSGALSG